MDIGVIERAAKLRASVLRLNLRRDPGFDGLSVEKLAEIYNGIGPDKWPEALRAAMTAENFDLRELPFVHDVDYYFSDGSREGWEASQERWLWHGRKVVNARYPLWQAWNYRLRAAAGVKVAASYEALKLASWPVWQEAAGRGGRGKREEV